MIRIHDFSNGSRVLSEYPLTVEQLANVEKLMQTAAELNQRQNELLSNLPEGATLQFFGKWDLLRIDKAEGIDENV